MKFNTLLDNCKIYEAGKPIELVIREYGIKQKDIIKLASNENPYGVSTKVSKKIARFSKNMFMYPDDSMYELKEALANKFEVLSENIIIGSGSDQVIDFLIKAKCDNTSKILMAKTTFAMYEIYGRQTGAKIIKTEDDTHNLKQFERLYKAKGADIIFLCLPNNPLGECLNKEEVYKFLSKINKETLVVIDGAYQEYASFKDSKKTILPANLIEKFPNSVYLGTFSKAYGLGGMRVGYAIGQTDIIKTLYKLRPPFNITTLSLIAAFEALKDKEFINKSISLNFQQMKYYEEYAKQKGLSHINSYTNFITLKFDNKFLSSKVAQSLLKKGIIVRDLSPYLFNAIRITIGTKEQNKRVIKALDDVLDDLKREPK